MARGRISSVMKNEMAKFAPSMVTRMPDKIQMPAAQPRVNSVSWHPAPEKVETHSARGPEIDEPAVCTPVE